MIVLRLCRCGVFTAAVVAELCGEEFIFISSDDMGVSACYVDTMMYIEEVEEHAEEGGALDHVEEDDVVDMSVVAEIVDSGLAILRCCRRLSSRSWLLLAVGCSASSRVGGSTSMSICIWFFCWLVVCVLDDVDE